MSHPHLIVAGAGIGGLTAAIALARRGIAVTLVEKRTGFGEIGAGLQLSPNAGCVLEGLDLALALKRAAVIPRRLAVRRWHDGAVLAEMPMGGEPGQTPFRALARADLHTVLLDAARSLPNVRLLVGRGLAGLEQQADGVRITMSSETGQSETLSGLGLIGADGLWSRTRELIGDAAPSVFTGYEAWRTLIPREGGVEPAEVALHLGARHHAVHYPVAGGRQTNLVIIRSAREAREGWSRDGAPDRLASEITGATAGLRQLAATAPCWQVWSLYDRPAAAMARGRVALLGDAAHPVLPFLAQGAALAIEDAAILASGIAAHLETGGGAALPAALAAYAKARQTRVARVQQASRDNGRAYHLGRPWSLARDLVMRRLGADGLRRRHGWVYGWRP